MGLILLFALISQIPYSFMLQAAGSPNLHTLNILFTWFLALVFLMGLEGAKTSHPLITGLLLVIPVVFPLFVRVEYGVFGVLTPLVFYFPLFYGKDKTEANANQQLTEPDKSHEPREKISLTTLIPLITKPNNIKRPQVIHSFEDYVAVTLLLTGLMMAYIHINRIVQWQLIAVLSVAFIPLVFKIDRKVPLPKIFAYVFYPGHITLLVIINFLLQGG